jgi:hypothetical protein
MLPLLEDLFNICWWLSFKPWLRNPSFSIENHFNPWLHQLIAPATSVDDHFHFNWEAHPLQLSWVPLHFSWEAHPLQSGTTFTAIDSPWYICWWPLPLQLRSTSTSVELIITSTSVELIITSTSVENQVHFSPWLLLYQLIAPATSVDNHFHFSWGAYPLQLSWVPLPLQLGNTSTSAELSTTSLQLKTKFTSIRDYFYSNW